MEDTAATLAAELDRLLAMARELEARVGADQGVPGAARELCAALAASVDRAMRLAGNSPRGIWSSATATHQCTILSMETSKNSTHVHPCTFGSILKWSYYMHV